MKGIELDLRRHGRSTEYFISLEVAVNLELKQFSELFKFHSFLPFKIWDGVTVTLSLYASYIR